MYSKTLFSLACLFSVITFLQCVSSRPRFTDHEEHKRKKRSVPEVSIERLAKPKNLDEHRLVQQIQSYIGVPYRWGGTNIRGMDCSGFVTTVYRNAWDLRLPRSSKQLYRVGLPITPEKLKLGDLVFFTKMEAKGVSHVGIYVGENKFAHTSTSQGVVLSGIDEKYYKERYIGARRIITQ